MKQPGDMIFIPSRYWHTARNLEETIGITGNFVNETNFPAVWSDLFLPCEKLAEVAEQKGCRVARGFLNSFYQDRIKEKTLKGALGPSMVGRDGIEPPTRAFSGRCSTD